ncbi:Imm6 family immunity protein [Clostridium felsineum]|uniref:Imm6 family immunity protein n=1 Tax=Clostridium felsineum TaxID=36839 RepID=UPI00098C23DB|nr:Imm6 family immunity protein [Clostridium felsineum]URZ14171.1 hypothetical protein CLFE_001560 [Clostridium felsineum DSM 794]
MTTFIKKINEYAKVTIGLVIAEKVFNLIDKNDYGYNLGREALDNSWKWLEGQEIDADELCDYIDNIDGEEDISGIAYITKKMKYKHMWYVLYYAVAYTSWMAYINEDSCPPEELDNVSDDTLIYIIENAIKTELFKIESINRIKDYLLENYPLSNMSKEKTINKREIMKMLDDN